MRKVLFVVQDFELGGTPMVLLRLIAGLDRTRFQPQLALLNARGGLLSSVPADCDVFDLKKGTRRGFPSAVVRYAALEARLRPDVVISALPNANIMCCLTRAARLTRRPPLIVTEHAAHISYLGDPKHRLTPLAVRRLYRVAQRVVVVSDGMRNELDAFYAVPMDRVLRIYNPVDLSAARTAAREPLDIQLPGGPVVVSVGRLAAEKAPADLLAAVHRLSPDLGVHLVFVGDGPLRGALEAAVARLGLTGRVTFAGSDANPYRWMARADVFVSSSIYEGFSLTIAEAMAVGVPIVSTDCPCGPRELLLDGRCGLLVRPGRPGELAAAIDTVLSDRAGAKCRVEAATERVKDFDQPRIVARYSELIDEVG